VYRVSALLDQFVTARVNVPTGHGVAAVPSSFSLPPTKIIHGTNFDTLEWDLNLASSGTQAIFWQSALSNLQADEVRPVALGATIQAGTGPTVTLAAVNVAAQPAVQTIQIPVEVVAPGVPAIANASLSAGQLGNTALANRLNDLSTALLNLVENPT